MGRAQFIAPLPDCHRRGVIDRAQRSTVRE